MARPRSPAATLSAVLRPAAGAVVVVGLVLTSCWSERPLEELDVGAVAFSNAYVDRGTATMRVLLVEGYRCPDGSTARVYVIEPAGDGAVHPLALLYHGQVYDYVQAADGRNYEDPGHLDSSWASLEVERTLGLQTDISDPNRDEGAWVAALLEAGFAVSAPTNCWGDLWHGRGRNDYVAEGFDRLGGYLVDEAIRVAEALPGISSQQLVAVGLGEGGRAVTELALAGRALDAVAMDSSPDWLSPVTSQPVLNEPYIEGLRRIYHDEVGAETDLAAQLDLLRAALQRDSMVHLVQDLGFRTPIVFTWSSLDPRTDPTTAMPTEVAITTSYLNPPAPHLVKNWNVAEHAPSNRNIDEARSLVGWIVEQIGPFTPPAGDDDDSAGDDDDSAGDGRSGDDGLGDTGS